MTDVPDGTYRVRNVRDKENYLDKDEQNNACATKGVRDSWNVVADATKSFCTITYAGEEAPLRLDLYRQNTSIGSNIIVHPKNNTAAQKWQIVEVDGSSPKKYTIVYHAKDDRAIAVRGAGHSVNCELAASNTTNTAQQWYFEPV